MTRLLHRFCPFVSAVGGVDDGAKSERSVGRYDRIDV